jgi:glutathione gamma-glutamylcysteinyltransferase
MDASVNTLDLFRSHVKLATSDNSVRLAVAYSRSGLGQLGDGHYSPIGAYHEPTDSCLILDVARFKYPPHWIPVKTLYDSMKLIDADCGKPRG